MSQELSQNPGKPRKQRKVFRICLGSVLDPETKLEVPVLQNYQPSSLVVKNNNIARSFGEKNLEAKTFLRIFLPKKYPNNFVI